MLSIAKYLCFILIRCFDGVDKMSVDKSWMNLPIRCCLEYVNGVESFLNYAFQHIREEDMKINSNRYRRTQDEVQHHPLFKGIRYDYTIWYLHGKDDTSENDGSDGEYDRDDVEFRTYKEVIYNWVTNRTISQDKILLLGKII